jgi:hypothetical protein
MTPSPASLIAGIIRSPFGVWRMKPASDGDSANRHAGLPFGPLSFFHCQLLDRAGVVAGGDPILADPFLQRKVGRRIADRRARQRLADDVGPEPRRDLP